MIVGSSTTATTATKSALSVLLDETTTEIARQLAEALAEITMTVPFRDGLEQFYVSEQQEHATWRRHRLQDVHHYRKRNVNPKGTGRKQCKYTR